MSAHKAADPERRGGGEQVKLPTRLMDKLRVIAASRRRTMMELLEEFAGPRIETEHRKVLKEEAQRYDTGGEG